MRSLHLDNFSFGEGHPLTVMCGPCVIESEEHAMFSAHWLKDFFEKKGIQFIFKASYDKANRSHISSFRGPGRNDGLKILKKIKEHFNLPIVTDIHSEKDAAPVAEVADILQIPAFLCRQTDLLVAAADTGRVVSVKKGQFIAPLEMRHAVDKIRSRGNERLMLVERGTMFGYNYLVNDFCSIPIMQQFGVPVCFDATHSVQRPGALEKTTGGARAFIPTLAKAALAAGADCLFLEAHQDPKSAKSDAATVLGFDELDPLFTMLNRIFNVLGHAPLLQIH